MRIYVLTGRQAGRQADRQTDRQTELRRVNVENLWTVYLQVITY